MKKISKLLIFFAVAVYLTAGVLVSAQTGYNNYSDYQIDYNNYDYSFDYNRNTFDRCYYHAYQTCSGNSLFWYDSCGNVQDYIKPCQNYNQPQYNQPQYNPSSYTNCTPNAYKLCEGNSVYWFDSCNNRQGLFQNCSYGQTCQFGQCVASPQPQPAYSKYYRKACEENSIYWYGSSGLKTELYQNCDDNNTCTTDTCSTAKCVNTLKCDGTTCQTGSADFVKYCPEAQPPVNYCGNGSCEANRGETETTCPADCATQAEVAVSFFAKPDENIQQWQKATEIGQNDRIYFLISVANNSTAQANNVNVSVNIPSEIASLGNVQVDGVPISGDIVSGINIGSVAPSAVKSVSFEGMTQAFSSGSSKQATASISVSGAIQTDSVSININPDKMGASLSDAPSAGGFLGFLREWYLWIIGGLVLVFLFLIIFRRISSET